MSSSCLLDGDDVTSSAIDETYEFSAPKYFDFINGESEHDFNKAQLWFETSLSYAPSPCMPRIKAGRSFTLEGMCDFSEVDEVTKVSESLASNDDSKNPQCEDVPLDTVEVKEGNHDEPITENRTVLDDNQIKKLTAEAKEEEVVEFTKSYESSAALRREPSSVVQSRTPKPLMSSQKNPQSESSATVRREPLNVVQACTPKPHMSFQKNKLTTASKNPQSAKAVAGLVRNASSYAKGIKQLSVKRNENVKSACETNFAQENQAIKRQKLDCDRSRQILNVKPHNLTHKSRPGLESRNSDLNSAKTRKENRKVYVREPAAPPPFVSTAEMMKKFESNTRDLSLPRLDSSHGDAASINQKKAKLTLTRPVEPQLETTQRFRPVRIKSSAELEEEMMAKIPKFKARPLNKKILEAPTMPALPRSTPHVPEFQEFHFKTMERASQHAETSTIASTESFRQNPEWKPHHLTEPKTPLLQTSLRARPPRVKSSFELELEELQKVPIFKAKPLNKKIFESKGAMGVFCNTKKQVTIPQEFHFATDERIPPPASIFDSFDKLSLNSERHHDNRIPRLTTPNPFHLHTEERGAEKMKKFVTEVMQKKIEEESARVPKANPYPYTTDFPVIPPKPEPKQCTKPEPFQLESLARHEEEMQREMEERHRLEKEEAQMRIFKAQPILKEDPIPVPQKIRKPLTRVEEFNLLVDHRAADRLEFDKKIMEKETMYKRYREETEAAQMMEEEKALKQMRRTMVPHARPVPNFERPFQPQKSHKFTKPKSPNLRVIKRTERRKMLQGGLIAAVSSAAANMR